MNIKLYGSDNLYEIDTENDGRKVITVKTDISYKVAFCGMIKKEKPNFEELDSIFKNNYPSLSGVWVYSVDRERVLNYLNNSEYLQSEYIIDENGYLKIKEINNQKEYDKEIEKIINSNNQYIISISSICYMIDPVAGQIIDNPYNDLEKYQTYEYYKDDNKLIIFITENKENLLTNNDIFVSLMNLQKTIDIK